MKKTLLVLLSALFIFALSACKSDIPEVAEPKEEKKILSTPEEDFDYIINGDHVNIKKYTGTESVVVIPERIEEKRIGNISVGFLKDSGVTEVTFPSYFTDFTGISGCDTLEIIHLSSALEKVIEPFRFSRNLPFRFCRNLMEIDVEEGGAYKTEDGVLYTADGKAIVAYPCGRTGSFTVPEGVETVERLAFSNSSLSEIILPDSLETINDYGFFGAAKLGTITVPSSVRYIGYLAFSESGIKEAILSEGLEEIDYSAFKNTDIKELYIPASVKKCGSRIADDDVQISVSYPTEGMKELIEMNNVIFRDETLLEEAFRMSENLIDTDRYWVKGTVFTDLTGDGFPEAVIVESNGDLCFCFYRADLKKWVKINMWYLNDYSENDISFPVYHLYYDRETDTYSYYSETKSVYHYYNLPSNEPVLYQQRVLLTDDGIEVVELYNDEIKDLSDAEIIKTFDLNEILSEYNSDCNDILKKFIAITDRFSEQPGGAAFEKALNVNGKSVEEYPYFDGFYPDKYRISVMGADVLRGEKLDGVYWEDSALVFDNAVIDAKGESHIIECTDIDNLTIKLIGENKIVSDSDCSLIKNTDISITFDGTGSLEAPKMEAYKIILTEGVKITVNEQLVSEDETVGVIANYTIIGKYGVIAQRLSIIEGAQLNCRNICVGSLSIIDNAYAEFKKAVVSFVWLSGNSIMNAVSDIGNAVMYVKEITASDNARLYADSLQSGSDPIYFDNIGYKVEIHNNGILEINGNSNGTALSLASANAGTLIVNDNGKVIINGIVTYTYSNNRENNDQ